MNLALVLLDVLKTGLGLWESKEKRKYINKLRKLEKELYEQEAKPLEKRDQAVIDNLHFDIMLISRSFAQDAGSNALDKS